MVEAIPNQLSANQAQPMQEYVQNIINQQLMDKLQLAYFAVDSQMNVCDFSPNLVDYGFPVLRNGEPVEDQIDFMIGMSADTQLDLPVVSTPSGVPVTVNMIPSKEQLTVLISNATTITEQRQMLQQAANENELLVEQQKKLMNELEAASEELEEKNHQLEEASRLQTSFLSGVSHEFRTPLTSIIGYTNLVQGDLAKMSDEIVPRISDQSSLEYLNAVQRSSKHLLSLVENLLDHGKLDSDEINISPKPADLHELFNDVEILLKPLSHTKGIELDVQLDVPTPCEVVVDESRLRQCLINLIGNAIKFTDTGGVKVRANFISDVLTVAIVDTGIGISEQDLEKIRIPFYQAPDTGKVGTGLGLTITERIIELMGGSLGIESEVGRGTSVRFTMPAQLLQPVVQADASPLTSTMPFKLLLAEDDADIADLVIMMLSEQGIDVTRVANGALAVDALQSGKFDMVLMDIHMPVMTGYEAIEKINGLQISTPIVVMSASAVEADKQRASDLGCAAYLVKPVDIQEIISIANTVISR